jgi:hypothetical protein
MKTSGYLIFYISENEDFELWRALSQLSADDRTAFVKSALWKALTQDTDSKKSTNNWVKQNKVLRIGKNGAESLINDLVLEEIGQKTMAVSEEKEINPLKYLTNEARNNFREVSNGALENTSFQEDDNQSLIHLEELELLQTSETMNKGPLPGLDFLLSSVIGEEDDEKVIEFIRQSKTPIDQ